MTEHASILAALEAHDPRLAEAAALVHVSTTEAWFRQILGDDAIRNKLGNAMEADCGPPDDAPDSAHAARRPAPSSPRGS